VEDPGSNSGATVDGAPVSSEVVPSNSEASDAAVSGVATSDTATSDAAASGTATSDAAASGTAADSQGLKPPAIEWSRTYGGSTYQELKAVAAAPDGGLLAAGCNRPADSRPKSDAWILRLGADGEVEWDRTLGGSGGECVTAAGKGQDGSWILAGVTSSSDGDFAGRPVDAGIAGWAAGIDADGRTVWLRSFGEDGVQIPLAVAAVADGGYVMVGACHPIMTSCPGCPEEGIIGGALERDAIGPGSSGEFRMPKIEDLPDLNVVTVRFGGDGRTLARSCRSVPALLETAAASGTADGGAVLAYSFQVWGNGSETRVARIDSGGPDGPENGEATENPEDTDGKLWDRLLPLKDGGSPRGMAPTADDGFAGCGSAGTDFASARPWLFRLGSGGELIWETAVGDGFAGSLMDVEAMEDGGGFAAGCAKKARDAVTTCDLLAVRTDHEGKVLWTSVMGGNEVDLASAVTVLADGGLVAAGQTGSRDGDLEGIRGEGESGVAGWIVKFRP
jgi:hypothetical protein